MFEKLTFKSVEVRAVCVPLRRPVVSKVGLFNDWPLILIDLQTEEGVVGRSYLEPYLKNAARSIVPVIHDLAAAQAGKPLVPLADFQANRRSLNLIGYEGDRDDRCVRSGHGDVGRLAKAAGMPLAVLLGGTVGGVPAYNSNGLWLIDVAKLASEAAELVAEGGFRGLKLRLGRDRLGDDLAAIREVRKGAGEDCLLMVDLTKVCRSVTRCMRCHALDDQGLYWFEEPITYDNIAGYAQLTRELDTPVQLGENFYGPRDMHQAIAASAGDYVMPDLMRIGGVSGWLRSAPIAAAAGVQVSTHLYPEVAAHLMRVTETAHWLEWQDWANPILKEPFPVRDGRIEIANRPGVGIEWDERAIDRYRI